MNNSDIDFASTIKEMINYLYKAENQAQKDLAYSKLLELINARFGACPRCGHINSSGKFCSECGQQLAGEVPVKNDNIESVDYLVAKKGSRLTILCIADDDISALSNLRRYQGSGINAALYKRTIERIDTI